MTILIQLIYSGIALGMIYAVIAFGYQLTFATSGTLNFGQGESLMLGALVGLTLVDTLGLNYWLMIPIVCLFGLVQGALVERIGVKPALRIKSEFGWIMSTIALGIIFRNVAENVWGRDDLKFPSPLPESPIHLFGANVLPMELLVVVGALLMMAAVEFFNRRSIYGKAVVATSNDRDAAGLMGINTSLVITFSYALSSMAAAFAGVLVARSRSPAPRWARCSSSGVRRGDYRRTVERDGHARGWRDSRHRRDDDHVLHFDRLQRRAGSRTAAARAGREAGGPVRQDRHQEGVTMTAQTSTARGARDLGGLRVTTTLAAIVGIVALFGFPMAIGNPYYIHMIETIMIYAILLFGLDIVVGYTGQVSLGHAGLFGIGAYVAGVFFTKLGLTLWLALPASILITAAFGAVLALPALRVIGPYLAMVTLAFGTIIQILINEMDFLTDGPMGITLTKPLVGGIRSMRPSTTGWWPRCCWRACSWRTGFSSRISGGPSRRCGIHRWRRTAWACRCIATRCMRS